MSPPQAWPLSQSSMAARVRAFNWSRTPLGSPTGWSLSLRSAVETVLDQGFPAIVLWGPELTVCAYNDSYRPLLGDKPEALGRPFLEVWEEARNIIEPMLQRTLRGEGIFHRESPFILQRFGYPEQTYFDFGYSPLRDDTGEIAGVLNTTVEVTARVLAEKARERATEDLHRHEEVLRTRVAEQTQMLLQSQAEVHQQAQFLDTVMSAVEGQIYAWDRNKRFVYANRATERLWNLDSGEYLGKTMRELDYSEELAAGLEEQIDTVLRTGEAVTGEVEYVDASGDLAFYTYVFSPVNDAAGVPELVVGVSRDITRRIELERALEQANENLEETVRQRTEHLRLSEERYRTLFETIDQGFCVMQMIFDDRGKCVDYRFVETNPAFANHTGLVDAEGKTAREMIPNLENHWYEIYGRIALTGEAERFIEGSDVMGRWFEVDAFRVGEPEERKVALLFRDVSDRKRAEQEVMRVLGLLEGITRGSEDLIAALDADYRFLYFNEAYRQEYKKLWGAAISEGSNLLEGMAPWPEEQRKAKQLWSRALAGESFRVLIDFGPSPEEKRFYDLRFNPIRDQGGVIRGAAHIFRDVTEQVRTQENLRQSEERLRESDRRKDEYLAMLGHELRNPLAAVRSATELIKHLESPDARLQRASGVLERQSRHMSRLVDGLLEVSRIARGKIDLNPKAVDLREILRDVLEDRKAQFDARRLHLEKQMPLEGVWVSADPVRLAQVFDNIVGNALKFTPASGTVSIKIEDREHEAIVRIADTGVGLEQDKLSRIFEPFYQEKQDIARATGGLGLGLALVKGLVDLHKGSIEALSPGPGKGTTFVVRLPLGSAPALAEEVQATVADKPLRILIIEDNLDTGQALCDLLELRGHDVSVAVSGTEALDTLRAQAVDVVLCDLGLPGMSGYELAMAIRQQPHWRDLPLIALTGYGQPEDRSRTRDVGFNEHLTKPVDLQALSDALRAVVAS